MALEFTHKASGDVVVNNQRDIDIKEGFTVCLRAKSKYLNGSDLVVSNGTIYIYMSTYSLPSVYVQLGTKGFYVPWPSSKIRYAPLIWYSFCLAFTTAEQFIVFTVNTEMAMNATFTDVFTFDLKPTHTIGFRGDYPYTGIITDYNIWNKPLTFQELKFFANCDTANLFGPDRDMALRWSNVKLLNNSKDVNAIETGYDEICSNEQNLQWLELIHSQLYQKEAIHLCSALGGSLVYPTKVEDLKSIKDLFNSSKHALDCDKDVWIPVKRSKEDPTKWIYNGTDEATFLPWAKDQPNGMGLQDCIIATGDPQGYYDSNCHDFHCSACKTRKYHYLNLRGRCTIDSRIDVKYVMFKNHNEEFVFHGYSGKSFVYGESENDTWKLVLGEPSNATIIGYLTPYRTFPIGVQNWVIQNGYCENGNNTSSVAIKISQVFFLALPNALAQQ